MPSQAAPQVPIFNPKVLTSALPSIRPPQPIRSDTRHSQKRKQTLITLLDALTELNSQGLDQDSNNGTTLYDEEDEGPSAVDQLQSKGAQVFLHFQKSAQQLDKELQSFGNAVRQLGSSIGLLSSSIRLRQRLAQILFLFRENAADLFPRRVSRDPHRDLNTFLAARDRLKAQQSGRKRQRAPTSSARFYVPENLDLGSFPEELEHLARDVMTFLECLNEFPEFTDEAVNASILAFEGDLKYWASCLRDFRGQFRFPSVERYVHDLSMEMGNHLEAISSTISVFVDVGVPTIRFAQKHTATNLLNLSTVATFFSAVTATTIQFSFQLNDNDIQKAVNAFWFSSLVFSIASAVNSLLGLTWKQAMYRSPRHRVPWWVLIWIKKSPLIFLVISVAAFSVGLVLFTWGSSQDIVTCLVTTIFTGFSSFGLLAVSAWFALERVIYTKHKGQRWLADVLADIYADVQYYSGVGWVKKSIAPRLANASIWCQDQTKRSWSFVKNAGQMCRKPLFCFDITQPDTTGNEMVEEGRLPPLPHLISGASAQSTAQVYSPPGSPIKSTETTILVESPRTIRPSFVFSSPDPPSTGGPIRASTESSMATEIHGNTAVTAPVPPVNTQTPTGSAARHRFTSAVRSVIMLQHASQPNGQAPKRSLGPGSLFVSNSHNTNSDRKDTSNKPSPAAKMSRMILLSHSLKVLDNTETIQVHQALVRHLQFSPNGKWLATCSWDGTSKLYKVGYGTEVFQQHRTLAHPQGFVSQVAWSPKGTHILTKSHRIVKLWTHEGVCQKTIDRRRNIQAVTWTPDGSGFLSVEGHDIHEINFKGEIVASHNITRVFIHDVGITSDHQRILAVGTLTESPDGLQPHQARREKRIVVYNVAEKTIESQVPLVHDVRDITISSNGLLALVSFEHHAPPQLWRLDRVNDDVRLSLRHTYMPSIDVDFAGTSYFCGKDDQMILCASKNGHIHIWDRESATLLHDIRVPDGDLTCIAWNTGSDFPMFSTGCHDGNVKIWTSTAPQPALEASRPQTTESSSSGHSRPESRLSDRIPYSASPQASSARLGLTANPANEQCSRTSTSTWVEKTQTELYP